MFKLNIKVPKNVAIAVSGGSDSMAALDFLKGNRDIIVLHYNHGTGDFADKSTRLVKNYCKQHNLLLYIGYNEDSMPAGVSAEAWWRDKRYSWFESVTSLPIITAHHLDDIAETWLFTSMHGEGRLIPSQRDQYIRPFLTTRKTVFESWCDRKNIPFMEDPSNTDIKYMRNYIRHVMMPNALRVNPGLHKVLKKKIIDKI
jgi:tRNA(Ile)-lysidine synthase